MSALNHKRIAFCIGYAARGGVLFSTVLLAKQFQKVGCEVLLIVTGDRPPTTGLDYAALGVPIEFVNAGIHGMRQRLKRLNERLRGWDAVVFAESEEMSYVTPGLPVSVPVVQIVRNTINVDEALINVSACNVVVAISPVVREVLMIRRYRGPLVVIGNSTPFNLPPDARLPSGKVCRILYLGRLDEFHKNISVLPAIAAELKERGVRMEWTIAGSGADERIVRDGFREAGFDVRFCVAGRDEVEALTTSSDFSIISSNFEAFGLTVIEAMATGCLPVCSNAPAFSWILGAAMEELQVQDGHDAKQYADIICRLIDEPERCAVLRQRLFERQQAFFSPEVMGAQYASLLEGLFEGKGKNAARGRPGRILIPWRMRLRHSRLGRLRTERIKRRTGRRG
jgi:glycosyltransferase involved in cell wall biosynthesis